MNFKAEITEKYIKIQGETDEVLVGLGMYVRALRKNNISERLIKETINMVLDDFKKESKVETIVDNNKVKIRKFDLNGLSKEEVRELFDKEIFNELFK